MIPVAASPDGAPEWQPEEIALTGDIPVRACAAGPPWGGVEKRTRIPGSGLLQLHQLAAQSLQSVGRPAFPTLEIAVSSAWVVSPLAPGASSFQIGTAPTNNHATLERKAAFLNDQLTRMAPYPPTPVSSDFRGSEQPVTLDGKVLLAANGISRNFLNMAS
jgi:hypothetical protein